MLDDDTLLLAPLQSQRELFFKLSDRANLERTSQRQAFFLGNMSSSLSNISLHGGMET